ncbi:MAG: acetate/propionate family kinase [bacterium]|nr:acetate/propionate family kinase [bacterium]
MGVPRHILAVNCGSSSVKLALVNPTTGLRLVDGLAERVGTRDTTIRVSRDGRAEAVAITEESSHIDVVATMISALTTAERESIAGVGHRIVHGGPHLATTVRIDDGVLAALRDTEQLAPLHYPGNMEGIHAARAALPGVPDFAVFDTAFHRSLPPRAYRYAVPSSWFADLGVRRYGFHGISHKFVAARAAELIGHSVDALQLVTVHLGSGCSACAVRDGHSVDTTMGFTPLEGMVMGTRSGDIDVGAVSYVARQTGLGLDVIVEELTSASGLLGLSGISNDMRTLLADDSAEAALAVDVFCYRAAKAIGAMAMSLDRVDAIVLTGGIGEHSPDVRSQIMSHLSVLGVSEDPSANASHGLLTVGRVSTLGSTLVMTVATDEELAIAQDVAARLS